MSSTLRVLQVIGNRGLGGTEKHVYTLAAALQERQDVSVAVACKPGSWVEGMCRESGITAYPVALRRRFDFWSARQLRDIANRDACDIVHAHGPLAGIRCLSLRGRIHGRLVFLAGGFGGLVPELKHYDEVIAVSAAVGRSLVGLGVPERRLTVIPNTVGLRQFLPVERENSGRYGASWESITGETELRAWEADRFPDKTLKGTQVDGLERYYRAAGNDGNILSMEENPPL